MSLRSAGATKAADRLPALPAVPDASTLRVLMVGDLIGAPGRRIIERETGPLREDRGIDLVVVNGENVAGGMGLTLSIAHGLFKAGVDVITSGNHIWDKREIIPELDREERILRPINYGDEGVPGRGWGVFHAADGTEVAVINAQGRSTMIPIDNPFTSLDALLDEGAAELPAIRLVDFHCELTSEKNAMGFHLDGRVSAVVGTHTHVPTADQRILPRGTAYVSDLGMTGPLDSIIGFAPESVLPRFMNGLPTRFTVGTGPVIFNALIIDVDPASGAATGIERISRVIEE